MSVYISSRVRMYALAAVAAVMVGLSGCASTGNAEMAALQAKVDAASADAAAAKSDAAAARSQSADALRTANEAKAIAEDTETKIDRMFKKAMHK
ncbi:MAG: Lpp/OprI family alanine-zipper lipoprotein [Pseudomonadota bacterium]